MIKIENLTFSYENEQILKNINLDIKEGNIVTLLGESGCGKSTLLKTISGFINDYQGKILMEGKSLKGISPRKSNIAMVFQEDLLFPNMNVLENVTFGLKLSKIPKKKRTEMAENILEELGLKVFLKRHPYDLSGGQRQRVSIARALIMNPKLLLMDEPFSALDENLRCKMQELLKKIQKKYKTTILFVTHDRNEAFYLSDKIAIMQDGLIKQVDTPFEIYNNPKDEYICRFLGINNIFNGYILDDKFISNDIEIKLGDIKYKNIKKIALKSEKLKITNKPLENSLKGTIVDLSFKGGFYYLKVKVSEKIIEVIENNIKIKLRIDDKIYIIYDTCDIMIIE